MSLNRFNACALNVSEYLRPVLFEPPPPPIPNPPIPPPPGPPPRPPPPPPPRPPPPGGGPPGGGPPSGWLFVAAAGPILGPIPKPRLTRRLKATAAGPLPRLSGIRVSPGKAALSRSPKGVDTWSAAGVEAVANVGR